jgi:hypothetical protein
MRVAGMEPRSLIEAQSGLQPSCAALLKIKHTRISSILLIRLLQSRPSSTRPRCCILITIQGPICRATTPNPLGAPDDLVV